MCTYSTYVYFQHITYIIIYYVEAVMGVLYSKMLQTPCWNIHLHSAGHQCIRVSHHIQDSSPPSNPACHCENGGYCITNTSTCVCPPEYTGQYCEQRMCKLSLRDVLCVCCSVWRQVVYKWCTKPTILPLSNTPLLRIYAHTVVSTYHLTYTVIGSNNIVEAHCYVVTTSESILMSKYVAESINQTTDCRPRMFRPHRPSSIACRTVLYAVDEGLYGQNVLQSVV